MDPIHQSTIAGVPEFDQFAAEVPHQNHGPGPDASID